MLDLNASLPVHPAHEEGTTYIRSCSVQHKIKSTQGQERSLKFSQHCRAGEAKFWTACDSESSGGPEEAMLFRVGTERLCFVAGRKSQL